MPKETKQAIEWALKQSVEVETVDGVEEIPVKYDGITNRNFLVDKVREFFNKNNVECPPFGYDDLVSYLN